MSKSKNPDLEAILNKAIESSLDLRTDRQTDTDNVVLYLAQKVGGEMKEEEELVEILDRKVEQSI